MANRTLPVFHTASDAVLPKDFQLMQNVWASILNPVAGLPINSGSVLQNVALASGLNNVSHLLGRRLQGWFLTRQRAAGSVYDTQDVNPSPTLTLYLNASAAMVVDIFVF